MTSTLIGCVVCAGLASAAVGSNEPLALSGGPHLFIDDYLVAETTNLVRTTHQPEKLPEPILPKAEPWHEMPLFFLQVIRDPDTGLFRMWYNIRNNTPNMPSAEGMAFCFAYAESEDGIHWDRPNLGLVDAGGSADNNLFLGWNTGLGGAGLCFVDEGPGGPDPARRYNMGYYRFTAPEGVGVAFSADGLHFTEYGNNPVLTDPGDIVDGCWDPIRKRYIMTFKAHAQPEDGYKGSTPNCPEGYRRLVGESVSEDFINWKQPWRIVVADPNEPGMWEFYGMKPYVRGDLYLGFVRILRDDLAAEPDGPVRGVGWTELCTSRDGENWTRYREPFLDRNPNPGTFDRAHAWFGDVVPVGDKEYIYYCGYSQGHKIGERQIGFGTLRKDGFVSRDAGTKRGHLRTPLVTLDATAMTINAKVDGRIRVRVLDAAGLPLPGFDWKDCAPIRGDSVSYPVRWKGDVGSLRGKPVRLEFGLRQAELYGFDLLQG